MKYQCKQLQAHHQKARGLEIKLVYARVFWLETRLKASAELIYIRLLAE